MTDVMNKTNFCSCLETLRRYSIWENAMYSNNLDFGATPVNELVEKLHLAMCGFKYDWAYDKKLEFNWIFEWAFNPEAYKEQTRHGRTWLLEKPGILYDFLVFMNEHGWLE